MEKRKHPYADHIEAAARKLIGHPTGPHAEQFLFMSAMYHARTLKEQMRGHDRGQVSDTWNYAGTPLRQAAEADLRALSGNISKLDYVSTGRTHEEAYFRAVGAAQILVDESKVATTTEDRMLWLAVRFQIALADWVGGGYHPDTALEDYASEFGPSVDEVDLDVMTEANEITLPLVTKKFGDPCAMMLELLEAADDKYSDPDDPETEAWHKENTANTVMEVSDLLAGPNYELVPGAALRKGEARAESGIEPPSKWYLLNRSTTDVVAEADTVSEVLVRGKMW